MPPEASAAAPHDRPRCAWATGDDALMLAYHDDEWGVPVRDGRVLFEFLTLEGAQAGLSWRTILHRREGYRAAFHGWDIPRIAAMGEADVARLLQDPGIIRHRGKIEATIGNAAATVALGGAEALSALVWGVVGGTPRRNRWARLEDFPAETDESRALSRALRKAGFRFVGPTTAYAFMQACGLVDDHMPGCFRASSRSLPFRVPPGVPSDISDGSITMRQRGRGSGCSGARRDV